MNFSDAYGLTPFNAQQKAFSLQAMQYVSTVADLHFTQTDTPYDLRTINFVNNQQASSAGYASYPNPGYGGSDIFIDVSPGNLAPADGQYSALTLIHELGHALGLKHPFSHPQAGGGGTDPGPYLPDAEDQTAWTVMSYTSNYLAYHLQYSELDIAALQYLYGPSKTARTGDDTYVISSLTSNFIWDGAGKDTLSAKGVASSVTLYLEPGYWGFVRAKADLITAAGQVTVNFGTVIENLIGALGDDTLYGNGVDNAITGDFGNDTIDGGAGQDTAIFKGLKSEYVITSLNNGSYTIRDKVANRDGTDTISNVEYLSFKDGVLSLKAPAPAPVKTDFNGDAQSDILLQNGKDGACYVWEMDGLSLKAGANGFIGWAAGKNWQAKATGDFNGDGRSDILLQNSTDGACYVWEMDGLTVKTGGAGFVGWAAGPNWQVKATGDFDGDGKSDILLQNSTDGACYVWEMDGLSLKTGGNGFVGWAAGANWQVKATGDFNGDGKSDILLQNANDGACYVWEMDGLSLKVGGAGFVGWAAGSDWQAVA